MKKRVVSQLCAMLLFTTICTNADAVLLSYWNFNNSNDSPGSGQPGVFLTTGSTEVYNSTSKTLSPASDGVFAASSVVDLSNLVGTMGSTADDSWGVFAGDVLNAVGATVAGNGFTVKGTGNNTKYITFTLSTAGYEDLILTYAGRRSGSGYTAHAWSYSTDGTIFTSAGSSIGFTGTNYELKTLNLSSIIAVDNVSTLYMRVAFTGASTGTNSNTRIDNVQFNATAIPIPEPGAIRFFSLIALLVGGATWITRKWIG